MFNLSHWRPEDIKAIRFAFGLTLVSVAGYALAWPLAFLSVLMTGKLLMADKSMLSVKESVGLVLIVTLSMYAGLLVSLVFISYPMLFVLVITLALLRIFYMAQKGAPAVLVIMLLVGATVVPMLALQSQAAALKVVNMLVIATALAVVFALFSYAMIPGGGSGQPEEAPKSDQNAYEAAVKSVVVVMPLYLYIFLTNAPSALIILIFVAILAQDTSLDKGVKAGTGLLLGNLLGGLIGIIIYNLLVMVPSLAFFALLMASTWLLFGPLAFRPGLPGILAGIAFPAINVVLSGALGYFSTDASVTIYARLFQLGLVAVYIVLAFSIVDSVAGLFLGRGKGHVQSLR